MTNAIQEYQEARQKHRTAELKITQARAQIEVYKKDIENILASEDVKSITELTEKYQNQIEELKAITNLLNKETALAAESLAKLGMN